MVAKWHGRCEDRGFQAREDMCKVPEAYGWLRILPCLKGHKNTSIRLRKWHLLNRWYDIVWNNVPFWCSDMLSSWYGSIWNEINICQSTHQTEEDHGEKGSGVRQTLDLSVIVYTRCEIPGNSLNFSIPYFFHLQNITIIMIMIITIKRVPTSWDDFISSYKMLTELKKMLS